MAADVLVVGSTGLIGRAFVEAIRGNDAYRDVIALTRRNIPSLEHAGNIRPLIIDFQRLEDKRNELAAKAVFCALGTTIKKAGSRERFRHVDCQLPLTIAGLALEQNCRKFILVSAVGADAGSRIFYNRVKGELERDLRKLPFESIHILRPSLLMGQRDEYRFGEVLGKILLQPLRHLLPMKYRPVRANDVARKALELLDSDKAGIYVHEGAALSL